MIDQLIEAIELKQNSVALCLDTTPEMMPEAFQAAFDTTQLMGAASAVMAYNKAMLKALQDVIPCVKISPAYYEKLGMPGAMALAETLRNAKEAGYITILDGRKSGSEEECLAYAQTYLGQVTLKSRSSSVFPADFLSVCGAYGAGFRAAWHAARENGKGLLVPLMTEGLFGSVLSDGTKVYEAMADTIAAVGEDALGIHGFSSLGVIVDSSDAAAMGELCKRMPHTFFMVNEFEDASLLEQLTDECGRGALIASRKLIQAWKRWNTDDFATAAREEAYCLREKFSRA